MKTTKQKPISKKQQKLNDLTESLKKVVINTIEGKTTLHALCFEIGIKNRVEFYNHVEKLKPKSLRRIGAQTEIKKIVHDLGFVFKNGFELIHIEKNIFNMFKDVDIIEIKKRL